MEQPTMAESSYPKVQTIVWTAAETGQVVHESGFDLWDGRTSLRNHGEGLIEASSDPTSSGRSIRTPKAPEDVATQDADPATVIEAWARQKAVGTSALAKEIARWGEVNGYGQLSARSVGSSLAKNQEVRAWFRAQGKHPVTWILSEKPQEA